MFLTKDRKSPHFQIVYYDNGKRTKKSTRKKRRKDAAYVLEQFKNDIKILLEKNIISLISFRDEYIRYVQQSKSKSYVESIQYSFSQLLLLAGNIPI